MYRNFCPTFAFALVLGAAPGAHAQQGSPGPVIERGEAPRPLRPITGPPTSREDARSYHVRALISTKSVTLDSAVALLDRAHFSPAYVRNTPLDRRRELVAKVQRAALGAGMIRVTEEADGYHMMLDAGGDGAMVIFSVDSAAPFAISSIRVQPLDGAAAPRETRGAAFTTEELPTRLREAAAAGLAGQVLVRRAGQDVVRTSFGMADRSAGRQTGAETIYCIGSTPIDFTIAAALLLAQRGALDLDAPIGRYLPGVPADKATMTSRMIIDGRSGLANFHDDANDADADLTWIDRATAVKRILSRPLLHAPGTTRQPSHSAFGLLAAIVETASGTTYQAFLAHDLFAPLGMRRTGFFGETLGVAESEFATGYGRRSHGEPNIPPRWGRTSWLVMGSGGMVSTLDDLRRFYDGIATGTLLKDAGPIGKGMSVNGSDRGFLFVRVDNGRGDQLYLLSNTDGERAMVGLRDGLIGMMRTGG